MYVLKLSDPNREHRSVEHEKRRNRILSEGIQQAVEQISDAETDADQHAETYEMAPVVLFRMHRGFT